MELVRLAGSLHDLGKLAIPEEILRKPAPLTDAERLVIERHPQIGFRMLESLGVDPVATWVLHHHERLDGRGYPDGLSGASIPLGARIILVADAYDAMTSDRSYQPHLTIGEALASSAAAPARSSTRPQSTRSPRSSRRRSAPPPRAPRSTRPRRPSSPSRDSVPCRHGTLFREGLRRTLLRTGTPGHACGEEVTKP